MAFGDLFSAGNLGATGSGIGGLMQLGGGIYGAIAGSEQANKINQDYTAIAETKAKENELRRTLMNAETNRKNIQETRQAQYARSMALAEGSSRGAQFSSGLSGAMDTISGQSASNKGANILSNYIGNQTFDLNDQLNAQQKWLAADQAGMQGIQGMTSMFGSVGKSLGNIGSLASLAMP